MIYLSQQEYNNYPIKSLSEYLMVTVKETGNIYRLEPILSTKVTKNFRYDWQWVLQGNINTLNNTLTLHIGNTTVHLSAVEHNSLLALFNALLPLPTDNTKNYGWKPGSGWTEIIGGGGGTVQTDGLTIEGDGSGGSKIRFKNLSDGVTYGIKDGGLIALSIPAAQVNSDWNSIAGVSEILNKPTSLTPTVHSNTKHSTSLVGENGVIDAMTAKATLVDADVIVIEDSEDLAGGLKKPKKSLWSTVKNQLNTYLGGIFLNLDQTTPQTIINGIPKSDQAYTAFTDPQQYIILDVLAQRQKGGGGFIAPVYFRTDASDVATYKRIDYVAEVAETELSINVKAADGDKLARTYLYDDAIGTTIIDSGIWRSIFRAKVSSLAGVTNLIFEAFLYHIDTSETTLFTVDSTELNNTSYATLDNPSTQPSYTCLATDRFGVRIKVKTTNPTDITVYTIVGGANASYFSTPIALRHELLRGRDAASAHPDTSINITPTYTGALAGTSNQKDVNDVVDSEIDYIESMISLYLFQNY